MAKHLFDSDDADLGGHRHTKGTWAKKPKTASKAPSNWPAGSSHSRAKPAEPRYRKPEAKQLKGGGQPANRTPSPHANQRPRMNPTDARRGHGSQRQQGRTALECLADPSESYFNQPRFIGAGAHGDAEPDRPGRFTPEQCRVLIDLYCARMQCTLMRLATLIGASYAEVRASAHGEAALPAGVDSRFMRLLSESGIPTTAL